MRCQVVTKSESDANTITEAWGTLTWLASADLTGSDITVGRVVIKPGESNPRHYHDNCSEVLYLLQGQLMHSVGDESFEMRAGDTVIIPASATHNATNTGDVDADMIVTYSSGHRHFHPDRHGD